MANGKPASTMWSDILGGAAPAYGYYDLYKNLDKAKGDVGNQIGDLQQGVDDRTQFTPWGVTSAFGTGGYKDGQLNFNLSPGAAGVAGNLFGMGANMMGRAAQDPAARELEIYDRIRAGQMPGERRAMQDLDQQMFSRGRTGMGTTEYGSSPERFAFEKARAEADNQAMLGAMGQTQNELMNQYNIGSGMFNQSMLPHNMLQNQMGLGLQNQQLLQRSQLDNASLWAQLGLGGMSARENYANIQAKMMGDMYGALGDVGSGIGGAIDRNGGLWDTVKGIGSGLWGMINGGS